MIRTPTGEVRLDLGGKLAGRGAYLHRSQACLEGALRRHDLEKALRRPLPPDTAKAIAALATEAGQGKMGPDGLPELEQE